MGAVGLVAEDGAAVLLVGLEVAFEPRDDGVALERYRAPTRTGLRAIASSPKSKR